MSLVGLPAWCSPRIMTSCSNSPDGAGIQHFQRCQLAYAMMAAVARRGMAFRPSSRNSHLLSWRMDLYWPFLLSSIWEIGIDMPPPFFLQMPS